MQHLVEVRAVRWSLPLAADLYDRCASLWGGQRVVPGAVIVPSVVVARDTARQVVDHETDACQVPLLEQRAHRADLVALSEADARDDQMRIEVELVQQHTG